MRLCRQHDRLDIGDLANEDARLGTRERIGAEIAAHA
jgi:hypothetical protein